MSRGRWSGAFRLSSSGAMPTAERGPCSSPRGAHLAVDPRPDLPPALRGAPSHRRHGRRPLPGAVRHRHRHGPSAGRAPRPALGGRRSRRTAAQCPALARPRERKARAAGTQDDAEPAHDRPAGDLRVGAPCTPDAPTHGAPGGRVAMGRHGPRVRLERGHRARRRHRDAQVPTSVGTGRTPPLALP